MQSSLDMSVPGDLPGTLYRLYDYVLTNLQQANLTKELQKVEEADKVISELRKLGLKCLRKILRTPLLLVLNQVQYPFRRNYLNG